MKKIVNFNENLYKKVLEAKGVPKPIEQITIDSSCKIVPKTNDYEQEFGEMTGY